MSDSKPNTKVETSTDLQPLVESIAAKINNAPALNGGFDRMLVIVEHIQEKQEETSEKVDNIHESLYDPKEGIYARIQTIESNVGMFSDRQDKHLQNDERSSLEINTSLRKLTSQDLHLARKAEITAKLQKIAGEDLEKLDAVIKAKSWMSTASARFMWLLVGGAVATAVKALWQAITHR